MKYCPECASRLETRLIDGIERCACATQGCGFVRWDNPVPVVAALVEWDGQFVLARNARWPDGVFSFISGYLERHETPWQAATREVKEELGLDGEVADFIGCFSFFAKNQIILAYRVRAHGELRLGSEIAEVQWLSREQLVSRDFGPLTLTAEVVRQWLQQGTVASADT